VQGWVVAGLGDVVLEYDGSLRCFLEWEDTVVDEAEIKDETLREYVIERFKNKYGEDEWNRWIGSNSRTY
jgi:hypothetical protein